MSLSGRCSQKAKTFLLLTVGSFVSIGFVSYIQIRASRLVDSCSYLDPILIDIVALLAGAFLIVEGILAVLRQKDIPWISQLTRCMRVWLGFSIITIHILQVIHK